MIALTFFSNFTATKDEKYFNKPPPKLDFLIQNMILEL